MLFKYIFLFVILSAGHNLFGQNSGVTKKKLTNIFKESILQNSKQKVQTNSNPWTICNKDSAYYKSDTLILYPAISTQYRLHSQCCNFIEWTFYKKDAFVLTRVQICKEPTTVSSTKVEDWFTIKLVKQRQLMFLETISQGKVTDRFKVITVEPTIILIRTGMQLPAANSGFAAMLADE